MRDQIRAKKAKLQRIEEQEASIPELAAEFAFTLEEEFSGMSVRGMSDVVTLEDPVSHRLLGGYLQFSSGKLCVVWNPRGGIDRRHPREIYERELYKTTRVEHCPLSWIKALVRKEVMESLIVSVGGENVDEREAEAHGVIEEIRAMLSSSTAATDAEMTDILATREDSHLANLWNDVLDAMHREPADALTRCCRFIEAVCSTILRERGVELPADKSISPLVKAVQKALSAPGDKELKGDMEKVLSGIRSICDGIGSMRTHFGTAHGASSHLPSPDQAYVVLMKQAAVAVATFMLDRHQASLPAAAPSTAPSSGESNPASVA
ncbi:abortive infection family protein [Burkholderia gladioli]|uniref:abortive infection family protein n=1 Tax=Burkholderia gladioli TaxID=28095 RepID=UPI0034DB060C